MEATDQKTTDQEILDQIKQSVESNNVILFMKGTPDFPQCGFSAKVVQMLREHEHPFAAVNILLDDRIRQGVKEYSNWPTYPQLYIKAELVGGCDIITELHDSGELKKQLDQAFEV